MTHEDRAKQAVNYLLRTDAFTSSDYRAEIEAEIVRCLREERSACAEEAGHVVLLDIEAQKARAAIITAINERN